MSNGFRSCLVAVLFLSLVSVLPAGVFTTDPSLPPVTGGYLTASEVHTLYPSGIFPEVILKNVLHSGFLNITRGSCEFGGTIIPGCEQENFESKVTGQASVGGSPFVTVLLQGPTSVAAFGQNTGGTPFNTEMLALSLSGGGVLIRESPTLASLGQTTITDLGGGSYHIDSFFDIFTEISLDGGANWQASSGPSHVTLEETAGIPEPASIFLLGSALTALGLLRRRS